MPENHFTDDDRTTGVFARTTRGLRPTPEDLQRRAQRPPSGPPPASHDDPLWDAADVARYLKVSRSWVYHRAEAGLIPTVRLGALLRFDPKAIRDLALAGARAGGARLVSAATKA